MKSVKNIVRALALALTAVSIAAAVSVPAFAAQPDAASMQPILTASAEDIDVENGAVLVAQDEYAKAYINVNGRSGYIELSDKFKHKSTLDSIGGKPLKEIIKFYDGGYVDRFYVEDIHGSCRTIYDFLFSYDYRIAVYGAGPKSGCGSLRFIDETGDYYDLSIWDTNFNVHYVKFNSSAPKMTYLYWDV